MLDPQQEKTWQIRQTSLVIDLAKLRARFAQLASIGPEVLVVLKSDGYGLGMPKVAHALETDPNNKNLHGFGVANVEEGIALRKAHIQKPIYVLSGIQHMDQEHYSCLQSYSLTPVISSLAVLQETVTFLRRNSLPLSIHLKFNTGMNRLGLDVSEISDAISLLQKHKSLRLDGLLSHYAAADKPKHILTKTQTAKFRKIIHAFQQAGFQPRYIHTANSAGLLNHCFPEGNIARVGYELYKSVAEWSAQVYQVREIKKGEAVGYGPNYRTSKRMRIAVLGVGYGDGFPRALSNRASVLIHGKRCKIIGNVSMDLTMVDVSKVPEASAKSRAVLLGKDGKEEISAEELAIHARTIPWEILTGISQRVPRKYING